MAERVYHGLPLYTVPSLEYTPQAYNPLYYFLCGYAAKLWGLSLPVFRLISLSAFFLTVLVLAVVVQRACHRWQATVLAISLYAACFELSGAWYHLARIDSTFVLFLFSGLILLYQARTSLQAVASAAVLFLALLTKQTLLLYLPFCVAYVLIFRRAVWKAFLLTIVLLIGISIMIGNAFTNGLYYFYAYGFQGQRGFEFDRVMTYIREFALPLGGLLILTTFLWCYIHKASIEFFRRHRFYLAITVVSFIITLAAVSQPGGFYNNMMPTFLFLSLAITFGIHFFNTTQIRMGVKVFANLLLTITLSILLYQPGKYIPAQADYDAGQRIVTTLSGIPEPIWIPWATSYYYLTGRKSYTHWMNLTDIDRSNSEAFRNIIFQQIDDAIAQKFFAAVIVGDDPHGWILDRLRKQGYRERAILDDSQALYTKTGARWRPNLIFYRE